MTNPSHFTKGAQRSLAGALRDGSALICPVCDVMLDQRPVPPRTDVSYVRDRLWIICPSCHRSVVLDRRQPE